jgi:hypothetical protein
MRVARIGFTAVALGVMALTTAAQGQGGAPAPPPSTIHGVNFLIKSQVDNTFCVQVASGTTEGRTITLQTCGAADTQRWAFSNNSDDTNLVLDSQGMCLDGRNRKGNDGLALPVQKCRFGDVWRWSYLSTGQIKDIRNGKCLQVPGAASNANVSLADCDPAKKTQQFLVTH